jgi:hypoxanthine-guanine phosphoribosyltransferase
LNTPKKYEGKEVLIIEDLIDSGKTMQAVVEEVKVRSSLETGSELS